MWILSCTSTRFYRIYLLFAFTNQISIEPSSGTIFLITNKTYTIGRKGIINVMDVLTFVGSDIIIEDKSVSRNHAEIVVETPTDLAKLADLTFRPAIYLGNQCVSWVL